MGIMEILSYIFLGLSVLTYIFISIAMYNVAKKKGYNKEWLAWIPIVQDYVVIKYAKGIPWVLLLYIPYFFTTGLLASIISFIIGLYLVIMAVRICKEFNVDYTWLIVGLFIPGVAAISYYKLYKSTIKSEVEVI
ncbi:hypothetical protein [Clostridium septicum]|uniref:Uncharacterized protein n=1 Tax=Clostridium septicum TaxID=1504 RepID=A0A9N7PK98_CLOSE|nr:hypothetical protein [Clostridium septicum]AYE33286.1 hypothetical protein CP523_01815 [Clostridium septicum]MDU1312983.1 hypothetical protein [Clostridium septicum]QAS61457.1 hypothetical protein EI377_12335 [Clostridium septicum]UEC22109.1 hypothetical protein LK444_07055 [Clostridium septicum]USR99860.1 hypothetical protein NH397_10135 [Clostridium septicum]